MIWGTFSFSEADSCQLLLKEINEDFIWNYKIKLLYQNIHTTWEQVCFFLLMLQSHHATVLGHLSRNRVAKKERENGCHLGACNVRQVGSTDKGMRQS